MKNLRVQLAILLFSAVAAVASWQVLYRAHPMLPLPEELMGLTQPNTEQVAQMRAHFRLNASYALTIFGALGMLAGLPIIAVQSLNPPAPRRSLLLRGLSFSVLAVLAGGICGLLFSWIGHYSDDWLPITLDPLVRLSIRLLVSLLPFALAASVLAAVSTKNSRRILEAFLGGIIGALLASVAYALVAGMVFPKENSDAVLPPGTSCQLLLFFLIPWCIWSVIVYQLKEVGSLVATPAESRLESV